MRRWWSQVLPLSALHRYPPLLQHVPICTGGPQTSSQSSYAQGNHSQACSDPHRRSANAPALLLRRPLSLSGSFSKRVRPVPGVQGAPLRPQEDRRRSCSPPTHRTPPPSVFRLSQEDHGRLCSPPTHSETTPKRVPTRAGGARTTRSPPTHRTPPSQARRVESRRSRLGFPINE